jgi:hypothetical protein
LGDTAVHPELMQEQLDDDAEALRTLHANRNAIVVTRRLDAAAMFERS